MLFFYTCSNIRISWRFAIFTLFNLSSSSTTFFLVQSFIFYIFLNSTISFCSTFHLLPIFLFHLNFHIKFLIINFISTSLSYSFKVVHNKKGQYSILSLSNFVYLLVDFLIVPTTFFFTNGSFYYCWFNFPVTFVSLFDYLYRLLCIFSYFGMITSSFSLSHWFDLVWFLISFLASYNLIFF